ncbi:unnamed protein product [Macrosiphum euphorbiae]|uniref:Uncharacterized protein n=1 Tax=Macrosiphum euphorbiae TaxID=13131 RepID=A0AAV0Y8R2_9HEMI|nr:unnamed protein product [Macrosiphum euphorbiae]
MITSSTVYFHYWFSYETKGNFSFFDCIKYKFFSIISAIDICFKIFHLFNLEYPPEACIAWLFIQKYFYCLNTKFDKSHPMLGRILLDLTKK